jgi:hypothetical protein
MAGEMSKKLTQLLLFASLTTFSGVGFAESKKACELALGSFESFNAEVKDPYHLGRLIYGSALEDYLSDLGFVQGEGRTSSRFAQRLFSGLNSDVRGRLIQRLQELKKSDATALLTDIRMDSLSPFSVQILRNPNTWAEAALLRFATVENKDFRELATSPESNPQLLSMINSGVRAFLKLNMEQHPEFKFNRSKIESTTVLTTSLFIHQLSVLDKEVAGAMLAKMQSIPASYRALVLKNFFYYEGRRLMVLDLAERPPKLQYLFTAPQALMEFNELMFEGIQDESLLVPLSVEVAAMNDTDSFISPWPYNSQERAIEILRKTENTDPRINAVLHELGTSHREGIARKAAFALLARGEDPNSYSSILFDLQNGKSQEILENLIDLHRRRGLSRMLVPEKRFSKVAAKLRELVSSESEPETELVNLLNKEQHWSGNTDHVVMFIADFHLKGAKLREALLRLRQNEMAHRELIDRALE